ncbi:ferredoxin, partial [Chloroflexota bacterium]
MPKLATKEDLKAMGMRLLLDRKKINKTLIVCGGTGCKASGSQGVIDAINQELLAQEMVSTVHLRITGCHGFCEQGPIMVIEPGNIFYCHVTLQDA